MKVKLKVNNNKIEDNFNDFEKLEDYDKTDDDEEEFILNCENSN